MLRERSRYWRALKWFCWAVCVLFACALVVLVKWHDEIQTFATAHRSIPFYFLLGVLLIIPARVVALIAAYLLEMLFVGWHLSSLRALWRPTASVQLDILSIFAMLILPHRRLGYLLSFGVLYLIDLYAVHPRVPSLSPWLSMWELQAICFVLFQSFLQYWMHRLEHIVPALWALHKFHHSADRMCILTSARQTHLVRGVEAALVLLPMALLTAPTEAVPGVGSPFFLVLLAYVVYQTFVAINGYLVHSSLTTDYGWIGRWLLVSPRMHRLHHAKAPHYHDRNFTFDLVIWDRLFGTYATCVDAEITDIPIGLEDNPFNHARSVAGALREYAVNTYCVFWREIQRGSLAWFPKQAVGPVSGGEICASAKSPPN